MSSGLAPSKSTIYVSNLPFSLTNNDLHKIFEKYGTVVKVTILKDNKRRSKGVAFVLYLEKDGAQKAVRALNNTKVFDRTIKCSIANDNGRATEFIRKKTYSDKSRCYECGDEGHLSYNCPNNLLGEREPPKKKEKKRKYEDDEYGYEGEEDHESEEDAGEDPSLDTLASAIQYQQERVDEEEYRYQVATGEYGSKEDGTGSKKKKFKKDGYFSDEEELDD